jgi:hypothetical protein
LGSGLSQTAAAWIAEAAFVVLLGLGVVSGELSRARLVLFVALWLVGYFGLPALSSLGGSFVTSYVAILDIALVFIVLKGDLRIN